MAKILIVEDNADLGDLLVHFISAVGHDVTLRGDSRAALDTLNETAFDLVITDMFMPDRDGLEILRESKRVSPTTPVLAMSGGSTLFPTFDPLRCARQLGAVAILPKPFRRSDLIAAIDAALKSRPAANNARKAAPQVTNSNIAPTLSGRSTLSGLKDARQRAAIRTA
jgi:DNA-binding response OmpR family regulator